MKKLIITALLTACLTISACQANESPNDSLPASSPAATEVAANAAEEDTLPAPDPSEFASNPHTPAAGEEGLPVNSETASYMTKEPVDIFSDEFRGIADSVHPVFPSYNNSIEYKLLQDKGLGSYVHYLKDSPWFYTIDPVKDNGYLICFFIIRESGTPGEYKIYAEDSLLFYGYPEKETITALKAGDSQTLALENDPSAFHKDILTVHRFEDGSMLATNSDADGGNIVEIQNLDDDYNGLNVLKYLTATDLKNVTGR